MAIRKNYFVVTLVSGASYNTCLEGSPLDGLNFLRDLEVVERAQMRYSPQRGLSDMPGWVLHSRRRSERVTVRTIPAPTTAVTVRRIPPTTTAAVTVAEAAAATVTAATIAGIAGLTLGVIAEAVAPKPKKKWPWE